MDIHARLMKTYKQVPEWWFLILLIGSIALSIIMCFVWKEDVQLPWWGLLFAFALAWIVTLPIGVIQATTNQVKKNSSSLLFFDPLWLNYKEIHSYLTLSSFNHNLYAATWI